MSLPGKLRHLPADERWLLLEAAALVTFARLALSLCGFRRSRRMLTLLSRRRTLTPQPPDRIAWAVGAAARRIPGARTCLVEALAAQTLLARYGHVTQLRIGVERDGAGIEAHAWLERDGRPVFGRPTPASSSVFPPLDPLTK